jgi:magnesium transporter
VQDQGPGAVQWIDLVDPDAEALSSAIGQTLHPRALDQLLAPHRHRDDPRPTLEGHGDYLFGVFLVPKLDQETGAVRYQEIDLVVAEDAVVTVRKTCDGHGPFDCSGVQSLKTQGRAESAAMIAYHLVDEVAEGFLDLTDGLNEDIDELEDHVEDWPADRIRERLSTLRHDILHIRRILSPTRDAIRRVIDGRVDVHGTADRDLFDRDSQLHFSDAFEKLMRASEALDLSRDLIASVRDYHQAKVSNDQNEVMKRLTVIASLLLFPSLVVGFYGMNVHGEPEYHWRFGYEWVVGLIVVVTVLQLIWFRRRRWI